MNQRQDQIVRKGFMRSRSGRIGWAGIMASTLMSAQAVVVTLNPVADTYVQINKADENFGTLNTCLLKSSSNQSYSRLGYFKFDVNGLPEAPTNAVLRFYSTSLNGAVEAYAVSDSSWQETAVTWNTRPAPGALVGSATASAGAWFEMDVTGLITEDGSYSFMLDETADVLGQVATREATTGKPELILEFPEEVSTLTAEEVAQIETDLGITMTEQDKIDLASIVKPVGLRPQWRIDAEARIEASRKAYMDIQVVDEAGNPVPDAQVSAKLTNHDFKFGGIVWTDAVVDNSVLRGITTNRVQELFTKLYNSTGANNKLKPKLSSPTDPKTLGLFSWAQRENIPVRGHALIWPGGVNLSTAVKNKAEELSSDWDDYYHAAVYGTALTAEPIASMTVSAGDVLVVIMAANNGVAVDFAYSGTASLSTPDYAVANGGGSVSRWIREALTSGTVNIDLTAEAGNRSVAVYHLTQDGGPISLLDSTELTCGIVTGTTNQYSFGTASSGILIEGLATYAPYTHPQQDVAWKINDGKRPIAHSYFSNVSSVVSGWNHIGIENTSLSGMAFANAKVVGEENAGSNEAQLAQELKDLIYDEISEWAALWPVYEWDVANEMNGNNLIQGLIGWDQMAEWWRIAQSNVPVSGCGLMINEYGILSGAPVSEKAYAYPNTRDMLMNNIDIILADGGPLDSIGFQSRVHANLSMDELYDRLCDFGDRYGLPMVGTEFETVNSVTNEMTRAQMVENVLTTYFSHPLAIGLNAWTYMKDELRAMCYLDGTVKLNGLAWYYLHRIRYSTEQSSTSAGDGWAEPVYGFRGDYEIVVSHDGVDYPVTTTMLADKAVQVVLPVSNHSPVWNYVPYTAQDAPEDEAYSRWINWTVTDPDGDALSFAMVSGPGWVELSDGGQLTGTPLQGDVGTNVLQVTVSDGVNPPVPNTVYIRVLNVNQPPVWSQDPFDSSANEDELLTTWLNWIPTDPEGDTLTWAKVSGPSWLTLTNPDTARFDGTPTQADVGLNVFVISVSDGFNPPVEMTWNVTVDPLQWVTLVSDDFEAGFGSWIDGGDDVNLSGSYALDSQCVDIQDNSGDSSSIWLANSLDLTGKTELKIEFSYAVISFEGSEDFFVEFSSDGGLSWGQVQVFVNDVDFVDDGTRYNPELQINSGNYTFSNDVQIRFRCDASGNGDDVYIDNVVISAL